MKISQPDISYIVSLHNRPSELAVCMHALLNQAHQDFEVIVTDNTVDDEVARQQREIVHALADLRFRYVRTAGEIKVSDCYWASEFGMKRATGKWLCFPCEDTYYPAEWSKRMLATATKDSLDLVLCGAYIAGPEANGLDRYAYTELGTLLFPGYKPSFLVKASRFRGWINKPAVTACSGVDRTTLQYMVRDPKIRWGVCRDLVYVHN